MAYRPNVQPVPAPPKSVPNPAEKKRQSQITLRRRTEDKKLNAANASARNKALKKKGQQTYSYKSIQGDPDFGIGDAGPGTPYSIKSTKLPEKVKQPTGKTPPKPGGRGNIPGWVPKGKFPNKPLWPTTGNLSPMQSTDWKLAAIRRRLGNG